MSKVDLDRFIDFMVEYKKEITKDYEEEIERLKEEIKGYKQERERVLNIIDERNHKAIEIYENRNSIEYKKKRFMEDKTIGYFMYEALKGVDKE